MKPFDKELYDRDDNAKHIVIEWLETLGVRAWVNPDQYGIDLLGEGELGDYQIEVEVKQNWSGERFPYNSIHYSARKLKFIVPNTNLRFVTLNKEWTHACVVSGEALEQAKKIEKNTRYTSDESFIEIPIAKTRIYKIHA